MCRLDKSYVLGNWKLHRLLAVPLLTPRVHGHLLKKCTSWMDVTQTYTVAQQPEFKQTTDVYLVQTKK